MRREITGQLWDIGDDAQMKKDLLKRDVEQDYAHLVECQRQELRDDRLREMRQQSRRAAERLRW